MEGGRKGHKYDFHFLFWHQNALASPPVPLFFIYFFLIFDAHFPPSTAKKKNMHMLMCKHSRIILRQLVHTIAINAQAHTNALRLIQIETSIMNMGCILTM